MTHQAFAWTNTAAVFFTVPERFRSRIETSLGHYLTLSIRTDSLGLGSTRQPTVLSGPVATIVIGTDIPGVTSIVAALPPPTNFEGIRNFRVRF